MSINTPAEILKQMIESYGEEWSKSNKFSLAARQGKLSHKDIAHYLSNIAYLIRHTPIQLQLAYSISSARGEKKLADFYANKLLEEVGHDQWALEDLKTLGFSHLAPVKEEMFELTQYNFSLIKDCPALYLSYILFAEYYTVLCAPNWVRNLEEYCHIPVGSMTVLSNHVELDKEHVEVDVEALNAAIPGHITVDQLKHALTGAFERFDRFCLAMTKNIPDTL